MARKKSHWFLWLVLIALVCVGAVWAFKWWKAQTETPPPAGGTENTDEWVDGDDEFVDGSDTEEIGTFLNTRLQNATGAVSITIDGDNTLAMAESGDTLLGTDTVDSITIIGNDGATIRATGEGAGKIQANGNGTLTIKNVTIIDETPHTGNTYHDYLNFGGNVVFENCTFRNSIYLKTQNASLKNCVLTSAYPKYYSVWCSNGNVRFDTCLFMGYRALKIHEFENDDVLKVEVDGCTFNNISEKPGVVIGSFHVNPKETTVSVKNSIFLGNHAWDNVGCIEGVHGFYESDNPTSEFVFITENNTVNYTANVYNIYYRVLLNGEEVDVSPEMWQENGRYPTSYTSGTVALTVDDLTSRISLEDGDRAFLGWYLDKECEQKFEGTLEETQTGDIVLYGWYFPVEENELPPAWLDDDNWTKNY